MKTFGLVGKNIDYSFSRTYFTDKFKKEDLNCVYKNFDIHSIDEFDAIFKSSNDCLLYTSPSPRDRTRSRMPSSA